MKVSSSSALSVLLVAAVAPTAVAQNVIVMDIGADGLQTRTVPSCVGMQWQDCETMVFNHVKGRPSAWGFRASEMSVLPMTERYPDDVEYNIVQVRTDAQTGTLASGVLGDGMVFYPFEWHDPYPRTIGPWDCAPAGELETLEECCTRITSSVTSTDNRGNRLMCGPHHPFGAPQNPRVPGRVTMILDDEGTVIRPARVE